jgi:uncharacterized 2Fe-2S/4Fe-4S cluster protein (DUF4445 family)
MTDHTVHFLPDDVRVKVKSGSTMASAAQDARIYLTLPCGGRGACGKCTVFTDGRPVPACVTAVERDMTVHVPDAVRLTGQAVLTDVRMYDAARNKAPRLLRVEIEMDPPSLDDPANDASRVKIALAQRLGMASERISIENPCLASLPGKLRDGDFKITAHVFFEKNSGRDGKEGDATVLSFSKKKMYGIAVDIGTTTVAVALCDLETGFMLDTVGCPNPQAEWGADVISRIVYTEEHEDGTKTLRNAILGTIRDSVLTLAQRAGIPTAGIPLMAIAANTVMTHFLLGLPTDSLRREPYVPAACAFSPIRPAELGLPMLPQGRVIVLPSVSSYVGGDITAGVIATEFASRPGLNMLVDVGTNGEMVLAGEGFMIACSCSAGPSFEGAGISHGSRAVNGAIDNVYYRDGRVAHDVIGGYGAEAKSLCGSGLISSLSVLLQEGAIDRSGRFTTEKKEFSIARGVSITQADVFNLIRAKAAIFAGMRVLAKNMDLRLSEIDHIFIAGGFGRGLNIGSATNIGMLPPLPAGSFGYVGNTSLAGALRVLNDRSVSAEDVAASVMNLELSVGNQFMEEFTMACFLPHTEMDFYKTI